MREQELAAPLAAYFAGQGYEVSHEVGAVDLIARLPSDPQTLIAVELKTRITVTLLAQAAERKLTTPNVYVAVPLVSARATIPRARRLHLLLRQLEVGLIVVRFLARTTRVEVVLHPTAWEGRTSPARRRRIIREIDGRYAEFDAAGQPSRALRLTAYRQRALLVAAVLREVDGGLTDGAAPRSVVAAGAPAEAATIMRSNHYGWFERPARGRYRLSEGGRVALERHAEVVATIRDRAAALADAGGEVGE